MSYKADMLAPNLTVLLGLEIRDGSIVNRRDLAWFGRREEVVSGVTVKMDLILDRGDLGAGEDGSIVRESRCSTRRERRRGGGLSESGAVVLGLD
jgi:hypothetical protein